MVVEFAFPVQEFTAESRKWLGRTLIFEPSFENAAKGRIMGKTVLDVGCGSGGSVDMALKLGAEKVVGIDTSHEMILHCKLKYANKNNVEFREESTFDLQEKQVYDVATAIFVLQFSRNVKQLEESLTNIFQSLKPGGELYAFVPNGVGDLNPTPLLGIKFGASLVLTKTPPEDGEQLKLQLYNDKGEIAATSEVTFFYRSTYETCLKEAGFTQIEWICPVVSPEGLAKYGKEYFDCFFNPPKDIMFRARRPI